MHILIDVDDRTRRDDVASPTSPSPITVVSVNIGRPRAVEWRGREVTTAIWKEPVNGPVTLEGVNFVGDDQADRRVHGGPDKAVYAYAVEDYDWWALTTGRLTAGTFGENLTTLGIDLRACYIGDRWLVGSATLEVSQPREPCFKLGIRMDDDNFPGKFTAAKRPGAYLRIVTAGVVTSGDSIEVIPADQPAIRISDLVDDSISPEVLRRLAEDPRATPGWRKTAARALGRA
jgi:MOSC domain-containing protein YiiM